MKHWAGMVWSVVFSFRAFSQEPPLIVAHRGAPDRYAENTLQAFETAFREGADAIEADFRMTADGVIVCIHDKHTGRVAPVKMTVATTDYKRLRALDVSTGRTKESSHIPTFAEVANTVPPGRYFYIEVKGGVGMLPNLLKQIEISDLQDTHLRVISFDPEVIRELKSKRPELTAFWIVSRKRGVIGKIAPSWDRILKTLKESGADGLSANKRHVTSGDVQRILDKGYSFHVWGVEDPETAKTFVEAGTSSVTTKDPAKLMGLKEPETEIDP